jgi:hypothetical protein
MGGLLRFRLCHRQVQPGIGGRNAIGRQGLCTERPGGVAQSVNLLGYSSLSHCICQFLDTFRLLDEGRQSVRLVIEKRKWFLRAVFDLHEEPPEDSGDLFIQSISELISRLRQLLRKFTDNTRPLPDQYNSDETGPHQREDAAGNVENHQVRGKSD